MSSCPFCAYGNGEISRGLIVYEDEHVLVVPSKHQKRGNQGHCLVITRSHISDIYEIPAELSSPILQTMSTASRALRRAFSADGVSLRQNNGAASGQDVFHLHFHLVPRFSGDDFDGESYQIADERARLDQAEELRRVWGIATRR